MFGKLRTLKDGLTYQPPTEGLEKKAAYVCRRLGWSKKQLETNCYAQGVTTLYEELQKASRGKR